MRKAFLTALICMLAIASFGQTLSFRELLDNTNCTTFDCFNDFIVTKGFSLGEPVGTSYLYFSDKSFQTSSTEKLTTKNTAIILFNGDGSVTTGTRTAVKAYYQGLLTQIKAAGFTPAGTENIENGVIVHYRSKSYPKVRVAVQTDKLSKDGVSWTSYDVSLSRTR